MKRQDFQGFNAPLADLLPPEFDSEFISSFFESDEPGAKRALKHANNRAHADLTEHAVPLQEEADQADDSASEDAEARAEADAPEMPELPEAAEKALEALQAADERTPIDLSTLAQPLKKFGIEYHEEDDGHDHEGDQIQLDDPAAKPSWSGGGKGGGKGKDKDGSGGTDTGGTDTGGTDTGGTDTGGTDTGGTDTGGTDTGGTDTGGTDTGGTDTGGTDTGGTGETNPGSNDPNTYVSGMDNPDGYNIELVFEGTWSDMHKQYLANVAERLSDIITEDLPNHNGIDDIRLTVVQTDIDGSGGAWATGGPRSLRPDSLLPSTGLLRIDTNDMAKMDKYGLWEDLGIHEMLHAMGFGTLFDDLGLVKTIDGQQRFTGTNAIEAYNTEFASIASGDALSDQGVQLDYGAHWHHGTFGKEVMTSTLSASGNYLSDMSIAAMEDLGYSTIYNDAVEVV